MRREDILLGNNLKFISGLEIKHFTVIEIIKNISFSNYIAFTNYFILKPQDLIVQLWGDGIYYEDITHDELFIILINKDRDFFFNMFKLFTNCSDVWMEYINEMESEAVCYSIDDKNFYIDYNTFDIIYKYLKEMRMYTHSDKRYFAGEKTKKVILDEDYAEYLEEIKLNKNNTEFSDMVSFIVISNKRDYENVYSYPVARFYEEYIKTYKKQRTDYIIAGIHAGTINSKKVKEEDLKWFKT